jgi:hypothetical protein
MDEANARIEFMTYLNKGVDRVRNTNLEHAKGRLEWVLEQNPDIDPERLKIPPELQDIIYALGKSIYVDSFKNSAKLIAGGIACEAAAYFGIHGAFALERMNLSSGELLSMVAFGLSLVPIIPGLQLAGYGVYSFFNGIKDYISFKKEKWNRPLTPKERNLAQYVLMGEKK